MRHLGYHWNLDGGCKQLAQPPRRSFRTRIRCRCQVEHNARLCCRVCTKEHSRRTHHDVANVDRLVARSFIRRHEYQALTTNSSFLHSFRHYARIRFVCGFPRDYHLRREHAMALDDGIDLDPAVHCDGPSLLLPRESSLVSWSCSLSVLVCIY